MFSLDDKLADFFPEFKGDFFKNITIRHILAHSSGLPDIRPKNKEEWEKYTKSHVSIFGYDSDYRLYGSENEHMQVFQNLERSEFEPGTHYERQDPAYILVAPMIERVTGKSFEAWMKENIFDPAGMTETFYYRPDVLAERMAHGYRPTPKDYNPVSAPFRTEDGLWEEYDYGEADYFLTRADRGACSSARDFMRWNRALYSGKIISDSSLMAMYKPYIATDVPNVSFGLGTALHIEPGTPSKAYHLNSNGGFSIVEGSWPEKKLHYVVFSCRPDWDLRATTYSIDSIDKAKGWI